MKKLIILSVMFLFVIGLAGAASATSVTVTYTADNIVGSWYQNGGDPIELATGKNASDWRNADTLVLMKIEPGTTYNLIWEVSNSGNAGPGNPAGFLAQIDLGDELMVSSPEFMWADAKDVDLYYEDGSIKSFDDAITGWAPTTAYGLNGGDNIWTKNNGGQPIKGISEKANWIWTDTNFNDIKNPHIFIKAEFTTAPVPEPTTIILLGTGLAGLAGIGRRKFARK